MKKEIKESRMEVTLEQERTEFRKLLLHNPNYFGNLPKSPFKAVKTIVGNTKYEELTCVGFNPNLDMLEATVQVKLPIGYGGTLCTPGTTEYVRFFLDYGGGWENAGLVAFNVHDIPNATDCAGRPTKPLTYVATLPLEPTRDYCGNPVLPKVRAILSWEAEPPDDDPNWPMVWGNRLERHIQIKPRLWVLADVAKVIGITLKQKVKLPPIFEAVEPSPIPQPDPPPLKVPDLVKLYTPPGGRTLAERLAVEPHRLGFSEIHATLAAGAGNVQTIATAMAKWAAVGLDWSAAVEALQATSGNVSYEEVTCLGLDYNHEWLVATVHLKKPCGYSGDLCTKGSTEYIAFWADWEDTCEWTYLDTVEVNVHDIASLPAGGLHYTAILPVNLHPHRQPCVKPKTARVRAVLSWHTPPSTTDPNDMPYWGNRRDAHVQIKPGTVEEAKAQISIIGGIGIADINTAGNGMTKPNAKFAEWGTPADPWGTHMRECPFGGLVTVHAPPNVGDKYAIEVREFGSLDPPTKLTTKIWVVDKDGHGSYHTADPVTGLFDYLDVTQNVLNKLAQWSTSSDGLWEMRLRRYNNAGTLNLDNTPWYRIRLDNTAPTAQLTIDGGACDKYAPGAKITGTFVARDLHFGHFILDTLPASMTPPSPTTGTPPVSSGDYQTAVTGDAWKLDTATMVPCGYVVRVRVWDRTIRHSALGHHNSNVDDKGFCLLEEA
jgi:hypothetical protein